MIKDLTVGSPFRRILEFAFPMFLGMLFQQLYGMVDTMIVGRMLGIDSLAGVGATNSLSFMVIGFCSGVCNGFAIPIAQMFGAKDDTELRRYHYHAVWLSAGFAVVLTMATALLCRPILTAMNTPAAIYEYAYQYIFIIFLGIPFTFLYNYLAAVIRSLGDSRTPVVFLAISSVLNIGLDLVLIVPLHMGVAGAAVATVASQGISGLVCLFFMKKKFTILHATADERKYSGRYARKLCAIGIPMGLQYSITAIGAVVVQVAMNSFGAVAVAGATAAQKLNALVSCPEEALGSAMAPYTGQNVGARKVERVGQGLRAAAIIGFAYALVAVVIAFFAGRQLSLLFLKAEEQAAIDYSYQYLLASTAGYALLTLVGTLRFSIQGMGYTLFAIIAGVMEMIARSISATVIAGAVGYAGVYLANPMAWIFADAFLLPAFFYCRRRLCSDLSAR